MFFFTLFFFVVVDNESTIIILIRYMHKFCLSYLWRFQKRFFFLFIHSETINLLLYNYYIDVHWRVASCTCIYLYVFIHIIMLFYVIHVMIMLSKVFILIFHEILSPFFRVLICPIDIFTYCFKNAFISMFSCAS